MEQKSSPPSPPPTIHSATPPVSDPGLSFRTLLADSQQASGEEFLFLLIFYTLAVDLVCHQLGPR